MAHSLKEAAIVEQSGVFLGDMDWEQLKVPLLLRTNLSIMQMNRPTAIQCNSYLAIVNDPPQNVIAQAPTGSGKTLGFSVGAIARLFPNISAPFLQCVMLSHNREVARQIAGVVQALLKRTPFKVALCIPPHPQAEVEPELHEMTKCPLNQAHLVIATRGSLANIVRKQAPVFSRVEMLVVDEVDHVLIQHSNQSENTSELSQEVLDIKRAFANLKQILCFSATFEPDFWPLVKRFCPNAVSVHVADEDQRVLKNISQFWMNCRVNKKCDMIKELLLSGFISLGRCIIFANRIDRVEKTAAEFAKDKIPCSAFTGKLTPSERDARLKAFRDGTTNTMIASDVLARGLDVPAVRVVYNYDVPSHDMTSYLHRIGRTGRFGTKGVAVTFVETQEDWNNLESIRLHYNTEISELRINDFNLIEQVLAGTGAAVSAKASASHHKSSDLPESKEHVALSSAAASNLTESMSAASAPLASQVTENLLSSGNMKLAFLETELSIVANRYLSLEEGKSKALQQYLRTMSDEDQRRCALVDSLIAQEKRALEEVIERIELLKSSIIL